MANLYELSKAWNDFELEVDEDGVITNADQLEELEMARDEKIENCLYYIKNLEAEKDMYAMEARKLTTKKKVAENKIDRMKKYVSDCLAGEKWKKEGCPLQASYHTSHPLVVSDEVAAHPENFIPSAYLNHIEEWTMKKDEIKKALATGAAIEGCTVGENKTLTIR